MSNEKKTPTKSKITIPPGHIIVHRKWRNSSIQQELKNEFQRVINEEIDVDFLCSPSLPLLYITEADQMSGSNYASKVLDLSRNHRNLVVIADRNTTTIEEYSKIQDLVVLKCAIRLVPIGNSSELPLILSSFSHVNTTRTPNNSYKRKSIQAQDQQLITIISSVPGVSKLKAEQLIKYFGTLDKIVLCSEQEISKIVGVTASKQVYSFFNSRLYCKNIKK